jgi:hypothetical protein
MTIKIPSKQELDEQGTEYTTLPADDYLVKIEDIEEATQPKYKDPSKTENVLKVKLKVIETRDGEPAKDDEKEDATGRLFFFTANIESLGFQKDGTASKARQFLCYSTGNEIEATVEIDDVKNLLGKNVYARVIKKENQKGVMQNRVVGFAPVKGSNKKQSSKQEEIPVIDDDDIDVRNLNL